MNRSWLTSRLICATCMALTLLLFTPALAAKGGRKQVDDVEHVSDHGRIDWTSGVLTATGLGAIPNNVSNEAKAYLRARTFAKLDALRNLLMVVGHIHIDSHTMGADYEATSDQIRGEVEGCVRGAQIVAERRIPIGKDTMVEVTVATRMYGDQGLARVFVPEEIQRDKERPQVEEPPVPSEPPVDVSPPVYSRPPAREVAPPPPHEEAPEIGRIPDIGDRYTSVIIDTRGFKVDRCMSPKILRRDGSEVWGSVDVDPDFVIEHGIVVYAHTFEEARRLSRAGSHPLELHAIATARGPFPSDAVLSDEDAELLLNANVRDRFMDKFRVIFIVDPLH